MKTLNCLLIIVVASVSASAVRVTAGFDEHLLRLSNPQGITIACPREITYQIQPISEWDALWFGLKKLPFVDAAVDGRALRCNYSVNNGAARDYSTLSRDMPPGYVCTLYNSGNKSREFNCKRAVAPIKIKSKMD